MPLALGWLLDVPKTVDEPGLLVIITHIVSNQRGVGEKLGRALAQPTAKTLAEIGEVDLPPSEAEEALIAAAIPEATKRAYWSDFRIFVAWCTANQRVAFPASAATVRAFLAERATKPWPKGRGKAKTFAPDKPGTVERKLSAICTVHASASKPIPRDKKTERLIAGYRVTARGSTGKKAAPMLVSVLRLGFGALGDETPLSIRDRAAVLLGWFIAGRRTEVTQRDMSHVEIVDSAVFITITYSKTDVTGREPVRLAIDAAPASPLCPVTALKRWLLVRGSAPGPLFVRITRGGRLTTKRLGAGHLSTLVKRVAAAAGEDPRRFSAHSLRAGFATQAALDGFPEWEIRERTRHRSAQVLAGYIRPAMDSKRGASKRLLDEDGT